MFCIHDIGLFIKKITLKIKTSTAFRAVFLSIKTVEKMNNKLKTLPAHDPGFKGEYSVNNTARAGIFI